MIFAFVGNFLNFRNNPQQTAAIDFDQAQLGEKIWHHFNFNFGESIIDDDIAYLCTNSRGFVIANLSDKSNPMVISHVNIIGYTRKIALYDNYLFVLTSITTNNGIFRIYNVTDSVNPLQIYEYNSESAKFEDICIGNNFAYLITHYSLFMFDLTNIALPVLANTTSLNEPTCIDWQNDILYISLYDQGLNVYDVSLPESPLFLHNYNGSDAGPYPIFYPYDFLVDNQYIYAAIYDGLIIVNNTDPTNLTFCSLSLLDNVVYSSSYIAYNNDYIGITQYNRGFTIFEKNNYSHPIFTLHRNESAMNIILTDEYLYITFSALFIFDFTNPLTMSILGQLSNASIESIMCTEVNNNLLYIFDMWTGLYVYDIAEISNPQLVGFYDAPYGYKEMKIFGNYAFIYNFPSGIEILDISNPAEITRINVYSSFIIDGTNTSVHFLNDICYQDNYVFCTNYENKLIIIDISNILEPIAVSSYTFSNETYGIDVSDNKIYVGIANGLAIINVRNKNNPTLITTYTDTTTDGIWDIAVSGKYAAAIYDDTIEILNVGRSKSVKKIASIDSGYIRRIGIVGRYIWCTDVKSIYLFDLDNPKNPVLDAYYWDNESTSVLDPWDLNPSITDVVLFDNLVFLAYGTNGLVIAKFPFYLTGNLSLEFIILPVALLLTTIVLINRKKKRK